MGLIKGDTRSLDYSSCIGGALGSILGVYRMPDFDG